MFTAYSSNDQKKKTFPAMSGAWTYGNFPEGHLWDRWKGWKGVHNMNEIWVWVNTYRYIFSGMNIHLPAILGFTRYQGFDPSPYLDTSHKTGSQHLWILYQFIMDKTLFIL
jgi:hypothetical protein